MSNDVIFLTQIGSILGFIVALFVLYKLLVQQKDATIELLRKQVDWLDQQLKAAKENSPDTLLDRLSKRISMHEGELKRLSEDSETNEKIIKAKEAEIQETRILMADVAREIGIRAGEYANLRSKVDLCAYCEAPLVELKDIHDGDWTGSHRKYTCGYTILDGERIYFCPSDPEHPNFEREFEIVLQQRIVGDGWTCTLIPKTAKARMVERLTAFGKTKETAIQNLKDAYYQNPAKRRLTVLPSRLNSVLLPVMLRSYVGLILPERLLQTSAPHSQQTLCESIHDQTAHSQADNGMLGVFTVSVNTSVLMKYCE